MRNLLKATTLESKFPLLAVEGGCIISKDADITVVYRVELPELFTVTSAEYEAIHAAWCKALKVLPEYSVVHKQDWFIRERYRPATGEGDMSFLSRSYERHFNERPFLTHACFLYLTKTTRERMHMRSDFSTLCRGNIIPKEVNREAATKFLEAAYHLFHRGVIVGSGHSLDDVFPVLLLAWFRLFENDAGGHRVRALNIGIIETFDVVR